MARQFMKGNDAIIVGALAAGCRAYYGYPITPASEIAHAAALHFPALNGVFIQAESEVSAINMVYGTAGMGIRTMTASSSPGFSLKQEGLSYCAGAELPCVVVNIVRGGPGLGNIAPEQADYFQITKGGGHGNYRLITLAPNGAQEMCDLTMKAFDLADKYRNPACIMADGITGPDDGSRGDPRGNHRALRPLRLGVPTAHPRPRATWSAPSCWSRMSWRPTTSSWTPSTRRSWPRRPSGKSTRPTTPTWSWWPTAWSRASSTPPWTRPGKPGHEGGPAAPHHPVAIPHRGHRQAG